MESTYSAIHLTKMVFNLKDGSNRKYTSLKYFSSLADDQENGDSQLLDIPGRSPVRDSDSYVTGADGLPVEEEEPRSSLSMMTISQLQSNPIYQSTAGSSEIVDCEVENVIEVTDSSEIDPSMFLEDNSLSVQTAAAAASTGLRHHMDHGYMQPTNSSAVPKKMRQAMAEQSKANVNKAATSMFRKKGVYWKGRNSREKKRYQLPMYNLQRKFASISFLFKAKLVFIFMVVYDDHLHFKILYIVFELN
jgi:hypothetical protein